MTAAQTKPTGNARNFIQGTLTTNGDFLALTSFLTHGSVAIQLTGTWTGTVSFEATLDGTTWVSLGLFPSATPAASVAVSSTGNGAWGNLMQGWSAVRGKCTASMTGTVVITIRALQAQF